jgi:hypothetical protein
MMVETFGTPLFLNRFLAPVIPPALHVHLTAALSRASPGLVVRRLPLLLQGTTPLREPGGAGGLRQRFRHSAF